MGCRKWVELLSVPAVAVPGDPNFSLHNSCESSWVSPPPRKCRLDEVTLRGKGNEEDEVMRGHLRYDSGVPMHRGLTNKLKKVWRAEQSKA